MTKGQKNFGASGLHDFRKKKKLRKQRMAVNNSVWTFLVGRPRAENQPGTGYLVARTQTTRPPHLLRYKNMVLLTFGINGLTDSKLIR